MTCGAFLIPESWDLESLCDNAPDFAGDSTHSLPEKLQTDAQA